MKKYWTVFKISWQKQLEYRFNFFLGRLRNIVILLILYYIWLNLSYFTGRFAGYTTAELATYVLGVNIIRSFVFGTQSRDVAQEINSGAFSNFLIKPVNYFAFVFSRELGERCLYLISSLLETVIFIVVLKVQLFWQTSIYLWLALAVSLVLALFLYFLLSCLASLIAFWSREAMGPRFLFELLLEFASGAYLPLNILSGAIFETLKLFPFMYLVYLPISLYLGKVNPAQMRHWMGMQVFWIILLCIIVPVAWSKGLKKYSGEGI